MDWNSLRGSALEGPKKNPLDLKLLEYRILYIVREELKDLLDQIQIKDNLFGKWIVL
tara:strand:- start:123 stop:293 length:171 start_codon:yes stop_codon:yes gene_type:complete